MDSRVMRDTDEPAIHRAARLGDVEALERLIKETDIDLRADVDTRYGSFFRGLTPLMVAAGSMDGADAGTVRWLLEHGADPHAESAGGVTAAWYAAGCGGVLGGAKPGPSPSHLERLRVLLDAGLSATESAGNGRSLVLEAASAGDPLRLGLLLERGAPPHPVEADDEADTSFQDEVMKELQGRLPAEVLPQMRDAMRPKSSGWSHYQIPLFVAAEAGSGECVRLLLKAGADVALLDNSLRTALTYARSADAARALLEAGAGVREVDEYGDDLLHHVLEAMDEEPQADVPELERVADLLIEAGAPLELPESKTWSRLYFEAWSHHPNAVRYLRRRGTTLRDDERNDTLLHGACWTGTHIAPERFKAFIRELAADIPLDSRDEEGRTPLHLAVGGDLPNEEATEVLLELGAPVNAVDNCGQTALHLAADRCGEIDCARMLMEAGADPTIRDSDGITPADLAYRRLATSVSIAGRSPGWLNMGSSWHEDASQRRQSVCEAWGILRLLGEAPEPDEAPAKAPQEPEETETSRSMPPLHEAAHKGDLAALARLSTEAGMEARVDLGEDNALIQQLTPLMVAAMSTEPASTDAVRWLLKHRADPRARSAANVTAAWYAAWVPGDDSEKLRMLLNAGADPWEEDPYGRSLLVMAAAAGNAERLRLLIKRGVRPPRPYYESVEEGCGQYSCRGRANTDYAPLFWAARNGSAVCVKILTDAGADPNEVDQEGRPPLSHATTVEAAEALLAAGAAPNYTEYDADLVDEQLRRLDDNPGPQEEVMARWLLQQGIPLNSPEVPWPRLYVSALYQRPRAAAFLLEHGAEREGPDLDTPLHAACWRGDVYSPASPEGCEATIRLLVQHGFRVDARDAFERTPLHIAVGGDQPNPTAVRVLLELGAEVNAADTYGQTPLHVAAASGDAQCTSLLLDAGANPALRDNEGRTARELLAGRLQPDKPPRRDDPNPDMAGETRLIGILLTGAANADRV